jgi:hypothetical protein
MARRLITPEDVGKPGIDKKQKYSLDEPGKRLLIEKYDGTPKTINELVERLRAPRWKIHKWAKQLGLVHTRNNNREWTKQDETYLEANIHKMNIRAIAKKLGRTENAVRKRAATIGINKCSDGYTLRGLALALGCDPRAIKRWIEKGWLRGMRRQTDREQGDLWYFSDAAVRDFIKKHPDAIDHRKAAWPWLVDVLCGGIGELGGNNRVE